MLLKLKSLSDSISIHALREESDQAAASLLDNTKISIHALREESDFRRSVS